MPQKVWAVGEEVLAADFQTYVQDQVVPVFPDTATRDAQWTAPPVGAVCVTSSGSFPQVWRYASGAWHGDPPCLLGYATRSTAQTGISSTSVAIAGLQLTDAAPIGCVLEIGARVQWFGTAGFSADLTQVLTELKRDGITIQRHQTSYRGGASVQQRDVHYPRVIMAADGASHVYSLWMATVGGATISTEADATYPGQLYVKNLGRTVV